jgi:putative Ca2+/H+ antiporter (TMEM165/GDT1 family)
MLGFWASFVFILLAEMGDKTQLLGMAFASRFRLLISTTSVPTVTTYVVFCFNESLNLCRDLAKANRQNHLLWELFKTMKTELYYE